MDNINKYKFSIFVTKSNNVQIIKLLPMSTNLSHYVLFHTKRYLCIKFYLDSFSCSSESRII